MRATPVLLLVLVALQSGCAGPDCYSSCEKIFGDGDGECTIQIPGKEGASGREEMINSCLAHCEGAIKRNGEVGAFLPNERSSSGDDVSLDNEKQAALWMDCIDQTSCTNLDKNYCAPVKNFTND